MKRLGYYKILGLTSDATSEEIKKAFKILSDSQKMENYESSLNSKDFNESWNMFDFGFKSYRGFADIFEDISHDFFDTGYSSYRKRLKKGNDLKVELPISL